VVSGGEVGAGVVSGGTEGTVVESAGVEPVGPVGIGAGTVAGTGGGVLDVLVSGLIRKITSAVPSTTALAPPIAFTRSARGRVGFHSVPVGRCAGFRRFVTSSESYR
jgi:hypothetical protein